MVRIGFLVMVFGVFRFLVTVYFNVDIIAMHFLFAAVSSGLSNSSGKGFTVKQAHQVTHDLSAHQVTHDLSAHQVTHDLSAFHCNRVRFICEAACSYLVGVDVTSPISRLCHIGASVLGIGKYVQLLVWPSGQCMLANWKSLKTNWSSKIGMRTNHVGSLPRAVIQSYGCSACC